MTEELENQPMEPTPKAFSKGKAAMYAVVAIAVAGVATFQGIQKRAEMENSVDARTQGMVQAVLDYVAQQAGGKTAPAPAAPIQQQQAPVYTMSVAEQKAEARNANLDTTIQNLVTLVQQTNCTRVRYYLDLARSASTEQGISQEDWLLGQYNRTMQEMEAYALQVGYASDAGAIARTRSAFQEPLAVATALRAVYDGKSPACAPDALPAVTAGREAYRDALAVRQMRREAIANDAQTVNDSLPETVPPPPAPEQQVPIQTTLGGMQP